MTRTVLITGAAGTIGAKITTHFRETSDHELRLLDRRASGDIVEADFGEWDEAWAVHFAGVDTVSVPAGRFVAHRLVVMARDTTNVFVSTTLPRRVVLVRLANGSTEMRLINAPR